MAMTKSASTMHHCAESTHCPFAVDATACMGNIRLFAGLPLEAKHELISNARRSTHPNGSILVREGDPIESILILRSGRIKTFHIDATGEEHVLDVLHEGQAIWHGMFLKDHSYHYSVACLSKVELCSIHRTDFEAMIASHPDVAMGLIRMIETELDDAEEKITMLSIRDPKQRLAEYLLHRDARCIDSEIMLKLDDIARSIGLRPETVSRNFSALEQEGYVTRLGRGRLKVVDREGLKSISMLGD